MAHTYSSTPPRPGVLLRGNEEVYMHIGVTVPLTEFGADLVGLRDFVQATEDLGYAHVRLLDHVLGADPQFHPEMPELPYTHKSYLHEPLPFMSYLAGITKTLQLVTAVLILPQRQTALVAKQAAEVDVLSGGRLRLGIGVGWNPVEYEALGEDFHNRGRRCEEQIAVMRLLWTRELVTYEGRWHRVPDAGIKPLPVQRPIPVWMGGESEAVLRRAARLADGWITLQTFRPGPAAQQIIDRLHGLVRDAGRDPAAFGIEGRVALAKLPPAEWAKEL